MPKSLERINAQMKYKETYEKEAQGLDTSNCTKLVSKAEAVGVWTINKFLDTSQQ
jgi:hypothetical protein